MKNILLIPCFLFFYIISFSQQNTDAKVYDFSKINLSEIKKKNVLSQQQCIKDSLEKNGAIDSLNQLIILINKKNISYEGIYLGVGFPSAKINTINKELTANGFAPLSSHLTEVGFGFVFKEKRWIKELLFHVSLNKKSTFNKIKVSLFETNAAFNVGYAIINAKRFIVYPFAGLMYEGGELIVDQQPTTTLPSTLFGTSATYGKTTITKNQLEGTAGGAFDIYILHPKKNSPGLLISGRYGLAANFIDGNYRANGHHIDYNPDWQFRNNYRVISLKLVGI